MFKCLKKQSKKILIIILLVFLNFNIINFSYAVDDNDFDYVWIDEAVEEGKTIKEPEVLSRHAVIYDRASKTVIWGKNEKTETPMASTTKIMTAIVMCEELGEERMKETVEVCKEAAYTNGSSMGIKTGDKVTYHDLLYGLKLP